MGLIIWDYFAYNGNFRMIAQYICFNTSAFIGWPCSICIIIFPKHNVYIPFQGTSALAERGKNGQVVSKPWNEHSLIYPWSKLRKLKYFISNITRIQSSVMCSECERAEYKKWNLWQFYVLQLMCHIQWWILNPRIGQNKFSLLGHHPSKLLLWDNWDINNGSSSGKG